MKSTADTAKTGDKRIPAADAERVEKQPAATTPQQIADAWGMASGTLPLGARLS